MVSCGCTIVFNTGNAIIYLAKPLMVDIIYTAYGMFIISCIWTEQAIAVVMVTANFVKNSVLSWWAWHVVYQ